MKEKEWAVKKVSTESITEKNKDIFLSANFYIGDDIIEEFHRSGTGSVGNGEGRSLDDH